MSLLSRLRGRDPYVGWHDPGRLRVGRHFYGSPRVTIFHAQEPGYVEAGDFCSMAHGTEFLLGGQHRPELITTHLLEDLGVYGPVAQRGPILVGHDVWIGRGAKVLSGVRIGTGAVIGSYAIVAKDVRPYAIVVGNPAREVRRRFSDEQVEALLASRWWQLPDERVLALRDVLWSSDVGAFLDRL